MTQLARHQFLTVKIAETKAAAMDDETIEQLRALGYVD